MHTQPTRTVARAVPMQRDSGLPLIAGLLGYVALLPAVAFGVCALAIFI